MQHSIRGAVAILMTLSGALLAQDLNLADPNIVVEPIFQPAVVAEPVIARPVNAPVDEATNDPSIAEPLPTPEFTEPPITACDCEDGCERCQGSSPYRGGGWLQFGYGTSSTGMFNTRPHRVDTHQAWLFTEKVADGSQGIDFGYRADIMYGVDSAEAQSFGNNAGRWDYLNGWDRGAQYGWAMPQLYAQVAAGDLDVIMGHFLTIAGYETVAAPKNFFYSHSLTMFNSEPFTHTGVLAKFKASPNMTYYGGWTLGWDTGFDEFDPPGGANTNSNFLGGFSYSEYETTFTYVTTIGKMGRRGEGYTHSLVLDIQFDEQWNYVLQSDLVSLNTIAPGRNDEIGINQYLFYRINEQWKIGSRLEWWKSDAGFNHGGRSAPRGGSASYYEATFGVNYGTSKTSMLRPEIRYDWFPETGYTQSIFAIDLVMTF